MNSEEYALAVGKVVLGLKSVELALRRYLNHLDTPGAETGATPAISEGETLASNVLTNRDSLGVLIEKFNRSLAAAKQSELSLDITLAEVGEAVTTGRIWGSDTEPPVTVVRFSAPSNGLVRCTAEILMDRAWLEAQKHRLHAAYANVEEAGRRIQPERWVPAAERSQSKSAA
jgi:hypothetical protein